jgi:hypothetical protein
VGGKNVSIVIDFLAVADPEYLDIGAATTFCHFGVLSRAKYGSKF